MGPPHVLASFGAAGAPGAGLLAGMAEAGSAQFALASESVGFMLSEALDGAGGTNLPQSHDATPRSSHGHEVLPMLGWMPEEGSGGTGGCAGTANSIAHNFLAPETPAAVTKSPSHEAVMPWSGLKSSDSGGEDLSLQSAGADSATPAEDEEAAKAAAALRQRAEEEAMRAEEAERAARLEAQRINIEKALKEAEMKKWIINDKKFAQ